MTTGANKKRIEKKLSKSDPDFYSKIAAMAGEKIKKKYGTKYFRKLAQKSHPRQHYNGGRPKKKIQRRRSAKPAKGD